MFSTIRRSVPAIALVSGMLVVSATTGAVAAGMITGKQIKNGTVTSADLKNNNVSTNDVKDGTLLIGDFSDTAKSALQGAPGAPGANGAPGAPGVSGLELVKATSSAVATGGHTTLFMTCPGTKKLLSAAGDWSENYDGTAEAIYDGIDGANIYGVNVTGSNANTLRGYLICANVS